MPKVMIYGSGIDVYQTVTDDQAEQIYQYMLDVGISKES